MAKNPFLSNGQGARAVLARVAREYLVEHPSPTRTELGHYIADRIRSPNKRDEVRLAGEALIAICLNAEIGGIITAVIGSGSRMLD